MPTHPAIFQEIATRYGQRPLRSAKEVERFFTRRFRRLSPRQQERIRFELLCRDGQEPRTLSSQEVRELDQLYERENPAPQGRDISQQAFGWRRLAIRQATFNAVIFGGIGLSQVLPELAPAVAHVSPIAEAVLIAAGCLGNIGAALYEHRRQRLP